MRLIHVSISQLPQGTLINGYAKDPNWSEIFNASANGPSLTADLLRRWFASHAAVASVVTEAVYERVRLEEFANTRPSRFGSAFACGKPEAAMYFAWQFRSGRPVWFYELSANDVWVADMNGLNPSIELGTYSIEPALEGLRERAKAYWTSMTQDEEKSKAFELPEIILPHLGTVVRELTPPFMP